VAPSDASPLPIALEQALVRELAQSYERLNQTHFRRSLKRPQIALSDAASIFARWLGDTRTIEFSRSFVCEQPWGVVLEVLKHEMAHQFVSEILRQPEPAHGPAFRTLCEQLGIDARAQGLPTSITEAGTETSKLLERVRKLLALAQSDNQHEAEAAALAAQKLLLKHNLERPALDSVSAFSFRQIGRVTGRVSEWERRLGNLLTEHFFVDVIWVSAFVPETGKRGSVLEAIGSSDNLALAEYVYDFMVRTAERLWLAHKRETQLAGGRDRMPYLAGVMSGFAEKLAQQACVHKRDGLVWVPSVELKVYTRRRHPYLRTVSHQGHRRGDAFSQGQRAGRDVVLHRGITQQSSGQTRLLRG
jgi:predicted SprT family Zn-dependent metalloprotease